MLYRKTTTAFSAVILGVMALLGATAHAQINLNAAGTRLDPIAVVTFSKETLPRPGARETHFSVWVPSASQNAMTLRSVLGTLIPTNISGRTDGVGGMAVRYDFENLQIEQAMVATSMFLLDEDGMPSGGITMSNAPRSIAAGGTGTAGSNPRCDGRTCVIFELGAGAANDLPASTQLFLPVWFENAVKIHPDGGAMARVRVYNTLDNALAVGGIDDESFVGMRSDTGAKTAIDVKSSLTTKITMGTVPAVADVAADPRFTNFAPAGTRPLGTIAITLNTAHQQSDGSGPVAMLDDVIDPANSSIVFTDSTENLGFGTFTLRPMADCTGTAGAVSVPAEGNNAGRGVAAVAAGTRTLCVAPKRPGTATTGPFQEIPVTMVNANVTYAGVPNNAFVAMGMAGPIGSIVRNGATVQISYLTVSDRYNQRIIITNRSGSDAEYELTKFYTEDGTEGTAGEDAMGMVPMESSIVVLTRDAVQFTGSRSRGSATLAITAPARMISVATTQVNLSDGSTDTINYEVMGAGQ